MFLPTRFTSPLRFASPREFSSSSFLHFCVSLCLRSFVPLTFGLCGLARFVLVSALHIRIFVRSLHSLLQLHLETHIDLSARVHATGCVLEEKEFVLGIRWCSLLLVSGYQLLFKILRPDRIHTGMKSGSNILLVSKLWSML